MRNNHGAVGDTCGADVDGSDASPGLTIGGVSPRL